MKALQKFSFFFFVITISLLLRILCFNQKAGDMVVFLLPWFDDIVSNGGVAGLHQQVGNYGLLYQTLLALLTSFKNIVAPLYLIKSLSIVFDYVLAYSVSLIVKDYTQGGNSVFKIPIHYWAFAITLFVPTIILNSAWWGQCDAIYCSFCLLTLHYVKKQKLFIASVFLGIAFSCKLQTIFIVPFVSYYLLLKYKSIKKIFAYGIISALVFWSSGIVAFIYGRELLAPLKIYAVQSITYQRMYLNFSSFWAIFGHYTSNYSIFSIIAIVLTILLCLLICYHLYRVYKSAPQCLLGGGRLLSKFSMLYLDNSVIFAFNARQICLFARYPISCVGLYKT